MAVLPYNPFEDTSVKLVTTDPRGASIVLPSVTSIKISRTAQQTDVPIELGSDIAVHRRKNAIGISLSGIVTEVEPFDGVPALFSYIGDVQTSLGLDYDNGVILTVKHMGRTFRNMTIATYNDNQDATERADVWHYDLTLQETLIASTTTILTGDSAFGSLTASTLEGGPQAGKALGPEASTQVAGILDGGI